MYPPSAQNRTARRPRLWPHLTHRRTAPHYHPATALEKGHRVERLLNYRGGSSSPQKKEVIRAIRLGAVCYKPLNEADLCQIYAGFR